MYEVTVFISDEEYETLVFDFLPDTGQLLLGYPIGCWVDIGRVPPDDLACDSLNFRHEVEADLEPYEELV